MKKTRRRAEKKKRKFKVLVDLKEQKDTKRSSILTDWVGFDFVIVSLCSFGCE